MSFGVPFSDPVADGPVIQDASYRADLRRGECEEDFCNDAGTAHGGVVTVPIIFMMYYNTILHYGVEAFVKKCNEGRVVDGLIVPDLPFEEQEELMTALDASDDTILIQLVSPVSGARIPKILAGARGFVYCVSSMGVTGQGSGVSQGR